MAPLPHDGWLEICLVHRPKYDDWSHPKGKLKRGEDALAGALREVLEETGHHCTPGARLPTLRYVANHRPKKVTYWAAEATGGSFTPSDEVDRIIWLSPSPPATASPTPGTAIWWTRWSQRCTAPDPGCRSTAYGTPPTPIRDRTESAPRPCRNLPGPEHSPPAPNTRSYGEVHLPFTLPRRPLHLICLISALHGERHLRRNRSSRRTPP